MTGRWIPANRRAVFVAVGALAVSMVSLQFGATLATGLFPLVGGQGATTLRLVASAAMLAVALRPWRRMPAGRAWPALAAYGAVLGGMNLCFFMSIRTIPLGAAVAIEFWGPLAVAVLTSRRPGDFAWIGLAILGLLLLCPPVPAQHGLDPTGLAFAAAAGAGWAAYIVFGQRAGAEVGSQAAVWGVLVAALVTLPVGVAHAGAALLQPSILLRALGVGLFSSALPYSLEMVALTRVPARVYGTMTSLEPAIGALMGLALLGQRLTGLEWCGIAVVVAAAAGAAATIEGGVGLPE